ncbi:MAG: glycosyltransferase family 39 protein [Planctomycetaceae bacterium]|nr:glycosyltransferase family 39 protein [Planctomycetaceae bacterium]
MFRRATAVVPAPSTLPPREELWLLAGALMAGIVLRWSVLGRLAVEHYDEAVYASNLLFGAESGYEFPGRQYHAPALLPSLIEWTTVLWNLLGLPNVAWLPMLPGLVCGTALIPSVWWVSRRWFSPAAGVAAAWMVSLSEYHAFYSRTALTDPVVILWILWAVHWAWIALGDGSWKSSIMAGVFTALAWWTKYNGWLPIAIAFSGGLCDALLTTHRQRDWLRLARVLATMTGAAFVLWSPVLWDCQVVGGYAAVAANHRGYLQGWSAWWGNWLRQNGNMSWYCGVPTIASWLAAAYASDWISDREPATLRRGFGSIGLVVIALVTILTGIGYPIAAGVGCGLCVSGLALRERQRGNLHASEQRAGCLLAAWFGGLFLTTPLYQAYPRLCLPMWLAGVLGVAWCLHRCPETTSGSPLDGPLPRSVRSVWLSPWPALGATLLMVCVLVRTPAWEVRNQTRIAARGLVSQVADHSRTIVYVYADPALFHELSQAGFAAAPRGDFRIAKNPSAAETLLALGLYVDRLRDFPENWAAEAHRFELLTELPVEPSSLVLLDNDSPAELLMDPARRKRIWKVFRVR